MLDQSLTHLKTCCVGQFHFKTKSCSSSVDATPLALNF